MNGMQADNPHPDDERNQSSSSRPSRWASLKQRKAIIFGVGGVVIVAAIVAALLLSRSHTTYGPGTPNSQRGANTSNADPFMQQYGQNCKDRDVSFTSAPMRTNDLSFIRPLGAMNDGHVTPTDHVYVGPPNPSAADNTYPVLMPANGTVTQVDEMPAEYIGDRTGQQVAPEDHRIVVSFSCRYFSIYIHVHKLSDALKNVVGTLQPSQNKQTNVELKAGDVVGYIGGNTFDWIPIDVSTKLSGFITPSLYEGEPWKIHTVSPFDLYKEPLKSQLEAKSLRSAAPVGGKIDYDQAGKLIGTWFRQGSGGYRGNDQQRYWDGHLSIVPDYLDPTSMVVSTGNWQGVAKQFVVDTAIDPSKVSRSSGMVKYELKDLNYVTADGGSWQSGTFTRGIHPSQSGPVAGTILLQVLDGEKLKMEEFPGKKAVDVTGFTSAAQTYER